MARRELRFGAKQRPSPLNLARERKRRKPQLAALPIWNPGMAIRVFWQQVKQRRVRGLRIVPVTGHSLQDAA
ncbi:hypothetical protein [Paenibacillus rhizophilus]|uniref:Uncharacterized protein n=1 Tax=Paenibacillus rhizophilus TaxID=1850366 RepID=A0A3N9P160_9BACL|nr:hypothetical protein [Paenibacillus rhizophilus]RQW09918.1 hypothetical protein EH198_17710 [Paenibacillus rhizophilus]